MADDITEEFRALVKKAAGDKGQTVDSSILRPVHRPTEFSKTVFEVSRQIQKSRGFVEDQKNKYIHPGVISDEERNRIEMEVVSFIKMCSASVEHLSRTVGALHEKKTLAQIDMSDQAIAHRHGMVLMLSEELRALTLLLDKYRSEYATQLKAIDARRKRQQIKQEARIQNSLISQDSSPSGSQKDPTFNSESMLSQQMLQEESQALYDELTHLSDRVHDTEKMMQEIATLNQMLSTQIMGQSEQIEQIYSDAVQSSLNMERGNKHLKKAVDLNRSTRKYILVLLIAAAFVLLFFDWFYS